MYGMAVALALPAFWAMIGSLVERWAPWPVQAIALKSAISGSALFAAAQRVEEALRAGHLDAARQQLTWLVSRPTAQLDSGLAASAAIESLAENFVDSWLAPLLAYAAFGLGGAFAYRAANTADAMWGYRTPEFEWLGKGIARLDDLLNWLPARLGALLLVASGPRPRQAVRVWYRDAGRTASPNAGQIMAVAAGQLDVRLEKPGHYLLHAAARLPGAADVATARHLVRRAALASLCLTILLRRLERS